MIFKQVTLENYGVYGGQHTLDLVPHSDQHFDKPIVLFSGKNGVGKTTFLEAIRLCLHGSLALGTRVSRSKYKGHLLKRIHRSYQAGRASDEPGGDGAASLIMDPDEAALIVKFDFVEAGQVLAYRVERRWHRTPSGDVAESLSILENGAPPSDLLDDQKEHFLRELISPSALELFFFDGERLKALAKDELSNTLLASTMRSLLGLHLVEKLQIDLDVYIGRKLKEEAPEDVKAEIERWEREYEELVQQRDVALPERQLDNIAEIENTKEAIAHQEELIAKEGGSYAIRVDKLKHERSKLEHELEVQRRRVQEMCSGLMPFAVAPKLCRLVAERLVLEVEFKRWKTSQDLIDHQVKEVEAALGNASFWEDLRLSLDEETRVKVAHKLRETLIAATPAAKVAKGEVVLRLSEPDRIKLTGWIEQALHEIPASFAENTQHFLQLEKDLRRVKRELAKTPDDLILQPLVETLKELNAKLERLQREHTKLADDLGVVSNKANHAEGRLRNLRLELQEQQLSEGRLELASKTQEALKEYAAELTREKITLLEKAITQRFNELSRKGEIINKATIDPENFHIELERGGRPFGRDELSEGEKQLLAISIVWALRDISGMPLPVIVDTPLGRLDSDHRLNMIQKYFPQASHQVILLATDTEIDDDALQLLRPAVSHGYDMEFSSELARTVITPLDLSDVKDDLEVTA